MVVEPDLARLARTLGEPTRMRMLALLMEGRALTAKELAYGTGVAPATATSHLRKLADARLIEMTAQGRHKYFRIASLSVARAFESLMVVARRNEPQAQRRAEENDPVRLARFCYDHLAGRLGTELADSLRSRRLVRPEKESLTLTRAGRAWCAAFGLDLETLHRQRRRFAYPCLDWSERRHHVGGALGAALADRLTGLGWIARKRDSRVVVVTPAGRRGLKRSLGLQL